jgi:hypothetical protein
MESGTLQEIYRLRDAGYPDAAIAEITRTPERAVYRAIADRNEIVWIPQSAEGIAAIESAAAQRRWEY